MSDILKAREKASFQINLDWEVVTLPGRSLESIVGMFAHLESLAVRRTKNSALHATGKDAGRIHPALPKRQPFDDGIRERISYPDLGRQVIRAARAQIKSLQERTEEMQSLVLINQWTTADRLWAELLPDCKTPLFQLNFLEELWGIRPDQLEVGGWSLIRHWQQFVLIQAEVEVLLARRQNLVELSDALEGHLGLWLKRFDEILGILDEKSLA
jgi:hypothetical protein